MSPEIKAAKAKFKASLKDKESYIEARNNMVGNILKYQTPNWGDVKITLINW